jgi:hypothetical protein
MSLLYVPSYNFGLDGEVKSSSGTILSDESYFFSNGKLGIFIYDQVELTVISYKNRSIKYTIGYSSKSYVPTP